MGASGSAYVVLGAKQDRFRRRDTLMFMFFLSFIPPNDTIARERSWLELRILILVGLLISESNI